MNDQPSCERGNGAPSLSLDDLLRLTIRSHIRLIRKQVASRSIFGLSQTHRLRVNIRKATACLHLFGPVLNEKPTAKLEKVLNRFRREFGQLRDGDVLLERSLGWKGLIPDEQLGDLVVEVVRQRLKTAKQIAMQVNAKRIRNFESALSIWKDVLPTATALAATDLRRLGHDQTRSFLAALATPINLESIDADSIHRYRISCRHIRYHLEAAETLSPQGLGELVAGFKRAQQDLGQIHDLMMILEQLRKPGKLKIPLSKKSFVKVIEVESSGLGQRRTEFNAWWTREKLVERLRHTLTAPI